MQILNTKPYPAIDCKRMTYHQLQRILLYVSGRCHHVIHTIRLINISPCVGFPYMLARKIKFYSILNNIDLSFNQNTFYQDISNDIIVSKTILDKNLLHICKIVMHLYDRDETVNTCMIVSLLLLFYRSNPNKKSYF